MILIELGLVILSLLIAFLYPALGFSFYGKVERRLAWLAHRRSLSVFVVGALALGLRVAVLPILPIPYPGAQDEDSYLLMADTFAHGRLTNPTHPLWVHFESNLVLQRPTYCSIYYPAQGAFLALGQIIGKHPFWGVWLSAGLMCGAICWMLQAWVAPFWALIGGLLVAIRIGAFSYWANSYWGGAVTALGGALVLGALLRIKRNWRIRDALLMGAGFALLFGSRPYESLFFSIPIFAVLIVWLCRCDTRTTRRRLIQVALPLSLVLVAAAAFMFYYFWRTTGNPFIPPYVINFRTYGVDPNFAWLPLRPIPQYHHEIIRRHYLDFDVGQYQFVRQHPVISSLIKLLVLWFFFLGPVLSLPFLALGFVLPYGMSFKDVSSKTRFLIVIGGTTLLGILLAVPINPHYAAAVTAPIYALVVMAMQRIRRWRPGGKHSGLFLARAGPGAALLLLLIRIAIPILHLPNSNSPPAIWCTIYRQLVPRAQVENQLRALPGDHVLLVHYDPNHYEGEGWIANSADIDRSKIIWAYDMGAEQDRELMQYFAGRDAWIVYPDESPVRLSPYKYSDGKAAH